MNAAARTLNEHNLFTGQWVKINLSFGQRMIVSLLSLFLLTAMLIVYVTNESRSLSSELEKQEQRTHALYLEWGQLLLEQASLVTPARVEQVASQKLGMRLPVKPNTLVLDVL